MTRLEKAIAQVNEHRMTDVLENFLGPEEDLDPELVPYLEKSKFLGQVLKHPLVFDVPHFDRMNHRANEALRYKKQALAEAVAAKRWYTVLMLHERPYRPDGFVKYAHLMDDVSYWETAGAMWVDTENHHQWRNLTSFIYEAPRPRREFLMNEDEREALAALPDDLIVYRGYQSHGAKCWDWSLDINVARFFANRFNCEGTIATGHVKKANVIAYFTNRGEDEIFVNPKHVTLKARTPAAV